MEHEKKLTAESVHYDYDDETMVDVKLFKMIGLYQLLQPSAVGGFGIQYRKFGMAIVWLILTLQCIQTVHMYMVIEDLQLFPYLFMMFTGTLTCAFKGYVLVTKADRFWGVLDAGQYVFTSCGRRDPSRLLWCRCTLAAWLRPYIGLGVGTLLLWILSPWFINEYVERVKLDGTVGCYRSSTFNFWYPIPESVYNWMPVWFVVYIFESLAFILHAIYFWIFDCLLVNICMALSAQFHTLFTTYETLGSPRSLRRQSSSRSIEDCRRDEQLQEYYTDLLVLINDNQKIMKKYDDFFDIVRSTIIFQIAISSYSIMASTFFVIQGYRMGFSIFSTPILKLFSAGLTGAFELYIYCHVFNLLETAKSKLNFGLYSGNWTEMDLKFKKTMLLAMNWNSAHMRVMRVSPISIVNLEMFTKVMKMSFSIVSLL